MNITQVYNIGNVSCSFSWTPLW